MKIKSETIFAWGIGISIIAASAFVVFGFVAWHWGSQELHQQQNLSLNDWGNYGSYLQGTTASLWALAGTFLIFAAFLAQKQQLKRQEVELNHIIKFVNESVALKTESADADYKNRRRYTSLVRAQLSAFELELLFYNGISPNGEKFKPLIEKYGLLENFDTKHLLNPNHEDFYAESAFE
jgi:Putative phage abortive infection protein